MGIRVSCDDCGREFRVTDDKAGRKVRCSCGASVRVPEDDDDFVEYEEASPRRSKSGRRKKSDGGGAAGGMLIGGIVAGVGVLAVAVVAMMFFRGNGNNQLAGPPEQLQVVPTVPATTPVTPVTVPSAVAHNPGTTKTAPIVPTTPTTPTQPTAPGVQPVVPAVAPPVVADSRSVPIEAKFQVSHDGRDTRVAFAPGGKFLTLDRKIYEAASGNEVWAAPAAFGGGDKKDLLALSPEGTLFAEGDEAGKVLTVYSKDKIGDESKWELPTANGASNLTFLQFLDEKRIVAAWTVSGAARVAVYDIEKPKKPVKDFNAENFSTKSGTISPDGKFLAVASTQALKVYDLTKGTSVASMATPAAGPLTFNGCSGVAFSPETDELAAVLGSTLFVWSNRGKLLEEYPGAANHNPFYKHAGLFYLPDKSGWFIQGQRLFDRKRKMAVWQLQQPHFYDHPALVLDADHVLVSGGSDKNGQIAAAKIPRDELAKAAKAIDDKVDSVLIPGGSISIAYEVGEPRFAGRQDVTNELHAVLTARLKECGIAVADNQPTTLKVVYTETPGEKIEFRDFGPRFGAPGPRGTTSVTDTNTRFTATLTRKDDPRVWWTTTITRNSPHIINGEATDQNIRNEAFKGMKGSVGALDLPAFLPVNQEIPSLPLKSDLGKL